jgi:hypothetical protein
VSARLCFCSSTQTDTVNSSDVHRTDTRIDKHSDRFSSAGLYLCAKSCDCPRGADLASQLCDAHWLAQPDDPIQREVGKAGEAASGMAYCRGIFDRGMAVTKWLGPHRGSPWLTPQMPIGPGRTFPGAYAAADKLLMAQAIVNDPCGSLDTGTIVQEYSLPHSIPDANNAFDCAHTFK